MFDDLLKKLRPKKQELQLWAIFLEGEDDSKFTSVQAAYSLEEAATLAKKEMKRKFGDGFNEYAVTLKLWDSKSPQQLLGGFTSTATVTGIEIKAEPDIKIFSVKGKAGFVDLVKALNKLGTKKDVTPEDLKDIFGAHSVVEETPVKPLKKESKPEVVLEVVDERNELMKKIISGKDRKLLEEKKSVFSVAEYKYLSEKITTNKK